MAKIYDFKTRSNKGAEVDFAQFEGKVLMIVPSAVSRPNTTAWRLSTRSIRTRA